MSMASSVSGAGERWTPQQGGKYPIDRPCSACGDGDTKMEYHDHEPPFRPGYGPATLPSEVLERLNQGLCGACANLNCGDCSGDSCLCGHSAPVAGETLTVEEAFGKETDKAREQFEEWAASLPWWYQQFGWMREKGFALNADGDYEVPVTHGMWLAYQAGFLQRKGK